MARLLISAARAVELDSRLAITPKGERGAILRATALELGCSVATVYRYLEVHRLGPAFATARKAALKATRARRKADRAAAEARQAEAAAQSALGALSAD